MKLLSAAILLVASVSTLAYGKTKTVTSYTTIAMGPGVMTYNQLCLNENNQLETKQPKSYCAEYKRVKRGGEWENVCAKKASKIFVKDLEYTKKVCTRKVRSSSDRDYRCVTWSYETAYHATTYNKFTRLYKWQGNHRDGDYRLFKTLNTETLEVPACK